MSRSAPRYDQSIWIALEAFDTETQSMAETCRQVALHVERLGLPRPSYVHMRRFLRELRDERAAERARREAQRRALVDAVGDVVAGRIPNAYALEERVEREVERRTATPPGGTWL